MCALVLPSIASGTQRAWARESTVTETVNGRQWQIHTLQGHRADAAGKTLSHRSEVWIYTPQTLTQQGVVLGLPGWKFAARTWEDKARISDHAEALGVRVALAEMHTTIYESAFYPQSRPERKWCGPDCDFPGSSWVGEVVVPYLKATSGPVRGLFGLSTGGRGAILVPQHYPGLEISRACAMSGTFDLSALDASTGEYRIHANVYGSRAVYPARWKADDSVELIERLKSVDVLLIHGDKDAYVPVYQSQTLADSMTRLGASVTLHTVKNGGHDWALWSGQLRRCLDHLVSKEE